MHLGLMNLKYSLSQQGYKNVSKNNVKNNIGIFIVILKLDPTSSRLESDALTSK